MSVFSSWAAFYRSDLQGLYGVIVVPALFLLWLALGRRPVFPGVEPRARGLVWRYTVFFALETIVDPIATGPALRWLGRANTPLADYAMIPFVLLGDWRVFVLLLFVLAPERGVRGAAVAATGWTLIVPLASLALRRVALAWHGPLPDMTIWLIYESLWVGLALGWAFVLLPRRLGDERPLVASYLRGALLYVATYYALWASADALILTSGTDWAWALRVVANQLYYGFWVPMVYRAFFSAR